MRPAPSAPERGVGSRDAKGLVGRAGAEPADLILNETGEQAVERA